uniref:helix-turn-helix domain-containing protein n=1 Tax=Stappia sp. TaxID=1870903 RepID=UPI003BAB6059
MLHMGSTPKIHAGKQPPRIHFIAEWAEKRGLTQADIVRITGIDKSNVSRWFKGVVPRHDHMIVLVECLALETPNDLFRHPDDDWIARLFRDRSQEERERMIATLEAAFPRIPQKRNGTEGN